MSNISVSAPITENISSLAAEVSVGGDVGVSGAISVYVLPSNIDEAHIDNGAMVHANGNLTVSAGLTTASPETITLIAGSAAGGGDAGVGISNATLVKIDTIEATIGTNANIASHGSAGLSLTANLPENIKTIAVAGAGAGDAGIAGSATVNVWNDTTYAGMGDNGSIDASALNGTAPSVSVQAANPTTLFSTAGVLAFGGSVGGGAGVDAGVITVPTAPTSARIPSMPAATSRCWPARRKTSRRSSPAARSAAIRPSRAPLASTSSA